MVKIGKPSSDTNIYSVLLFLLLSMLDFFFFKTLCTEDIVFLIPCQQRSPRHHSIVCHVSYYTFIYVVRKECARSHTSPMQKGYQPQTCLTEKKKQK